MSNTGKIFAESPCSFCGKSIRGQYVRNPKGNDKWVYPDLDNPCCGRCGERMPEEQVASILRNILERAGETKRREDGTPIHPFGGRHPKREQPRNRILGAKTFEESVGLEDLYRKRLAKAEKSIARTAPKKKASKAD